MKRKKNKQKKLIGKVPDKDASFGEVVAFCKANPWWAEKSEMGRMVMKYIRLGAIDDLQKCWIGRGSIKRMGERV